MLLLWLENVKRKEVNKMDIRETADKVFIPCLFVFVIGSHILAYILLETARGIIPMSCLCMCALVYMCATAEYIIKTC